VDEYVLSRRIRTWSTGAAASGSVRCSSSASPRYSSLTRSWGLNVLISRHVSPVIGCTDCTCTPTCTETYAVQWTCSSSTRPLQHTVA